MKKKGFTLIELLTVILLLGVIALITTPIVFRLIENFKEESRKLSVVSYADAVRLSYADFQSNPTDSSLEELADKRMQGNNVSCNIVKFSDDYGTLLHGCNISEGENIVGEYCYLSGNVYKTNTLECQNILDIADSGSVQYKIPNITVVSKKPEDTPYSQSKEIKIEYPSLVVVEEYYFIKVDKGIEVSNVLSKCGTSSLPSSCEASSDKVIEANTWYQVNGNTTFTIKDNISIQAVTGKGETFSPKAEYKEEKIDNSAPSISSSTITKTSSKAVVKANCSDEQSGIIEYYFKKDNDNWLSNGTKDTYTFTGLTEGTHDISVRCKNGSGLTNEITDNIRMITLIKPTITQDPSTASKEWAQSRTINISYQESNDVYYYFKTDAVGTIEGSPIKEQCEYANGKMTNCTPVTSQNISANVWYRVDTNSIKLTYTKDANITALISDGTNYVGSETYLVTNIDTTEPSASITSVTVKTDRATVEASCTDDQSGITKYEFYDVINKVWKDNGTTSSYTQTGLTQGTSYDFKVRCINGSGLNKTADSSKATSSITNPTITQSSQTPTTGTYATQRVIRITYNGTNVQSPEYYFKSDVDATVGSGIVTAICGTGATPSTCSNSNVTTLAAETWYKTTTTTVDVTYKKNGNLYASTKDPKGNIANASTYAVVNIDTTEPSASITSVTVKTDRATIIANCTDDQSGITKYEFYDVINKVWKDNGTTSSYTQTGLTQGTSYTYQVRCTNGSGLNKTADSSKATLSITNPTIKQQSQTPASGTYATQRVIRITYNGTNVESPEYYFKSDVDATVGSGIVTATCGNSATPGSCSNISNVTTLVAGTWYKTGSTTVDVTYKKNGNLYASTKDPKGNIANAATYAVVNIDTTEPSASITSVATKTDRATVTASCTDNESKITKYEFYNPVTEEWKDNGTTTSYTITGLTQNTNYNFQVRCTNGAGITKTASSSKATLSITNPTIAQSSQTPASGTYANTRVIKITYSGTNVESPEYYFKSDVEATVGSGLVTATCGNSNSPSACSNGTVTTLVAGTWYKTGSTTVDVTYKKNGNLYASTKDPKGNIANASTYAVVNIDATEPNVSISSVTVKTDRATVAASCTDSESGITKYEFYNPATKEWKDNGTTTSYTITGLTQGTSYDFQVRCTNGAGITKTASNSKSTSSINNPTIKQQSQLPLSNTTYANTRVIRITYNGTNVESPEYYFKSDIGANVGSGVVTATCGNSTTPGSCSNGTVTTLVAGTWYKTGSTTVDVTYYKTGNLYAATKDPKGNIANASTYAVTNIDETLPDWVGLSATTKTDRVIVTANCKDEESGIMKYEFYNPVTKNWIDSGTMGEYTITGLTQGTSYEFQVRCTNGAGMSDTHTITKTTNNVSNPTIKQQSQYPLPNTTYANTRTIRVTYNGANIQSPEYYVKATVNATTVNPSSIFINSGITASCGTGNVPGNCTSSSLKGEIQANTWYKVSGTTVDVEFGQEGYLYAMTKDSNGNTANASTYTVANIDYQTPDATVQNYYTNTDKVSIVVECNNYGGKSGISRYLFRKSDGEWIDNGTNNRYTFTGLKSGTKYRFYVNCTNGAGIEGSSDVVDITTDNVSNPTITQQSQYPSTGTYARQRNLRVTYNGANIQSPEYYVKATVNATTVNPSSIFINSGITASCGTGNVPGSCTSSSLKGQIQANTWYKVSGTTLDVIFGQNGTLYAMTKDSSGNTSLTSSYTSANIDFTEPSASISSVTVKTDRATIVASCADNESKISKYQFYNPVTREWKDNGTTNSYTVTGLAQNTNYTYWISCTNGVGISKQVSSSKSTFSITNPTIKQQSQTPTSGTYATQRVIRITYNGTNVQSPEYYFKSDVKATVSSGIVVASCGTGTTPGSCTSISNVTTLVAGTWYKTNTATVDVTYTANGKLYAATKDPKGNIANASTFTIANIDTSAPITEVTSYTVTSNSVKIVVSCKDSESGVANYIFKQILPSSKDLITTSQNYYEFKSLSPNTSYQFNAGCTNGAGLSSYSSPTYKTSSAGTTLAELIHQKYPTTSSNPTLNTTSAKAKENGLYVSTATNDNKPTYYFRGNVNNYVTFANMDWRVIRINEDGTVRIIMTRGINVSESSPQYTVPDKSGKEYQFNTAKNNKSYMYFSNSNVVDGVQYNLNKWYQDNIANNCSGTKCYSDYVALGTFCEQAKVSRNSSNTTGSGASMTVYSSYTPNFKCANDANGKGILKANIGLITYDELVHAGGYFNMDNTSYYLYRSANVGFYTMSPAGYASSTANVWHQFNSSDSNYSVLQKRYIRPVINLKADTIAKGSGTESDPWVVSLSS